MSDGRIMVAECDGAYLMKFVGDVRLNVSPAMNRFVDEMFQDKDFRTVLIDLSNTKRIDSTSLGVLARMSIRAKQQYGVVPALVSTNPDITHILRTMGFEDVFHLIKCPLEESSQLRDLPDTEYTTEELRQHVLEAHHALMGLNESNREEFGHLVANLEASG